MHKTYRRNAGIAMAAMGAAVVSAPPAWAGICPVEQTSADNPVPMPRLLSVVIGSARDPISPTKGQQAQVRITAGHYVEGKLRVEMTFDAPVPQGCRLPIRLYAGATMSDSYDGAAERALDAIVDNDPPGNISSLLANLAVLGSGNEKAELIVPIQADVISGRNELKIVYRGNFSDARPLVFQAERLPPFEAIALPGPATFNNPVVASFRQPAPLLEESRALPVTFTVVPASLGGLKLVQSSPTSAQPAASLRAQWSPAFTPLVARAMFVAADLANDATGEIRASWNGHTLSLPITVAGNRQCQPRFTVAAVRGGVRFAVSNVGRGPCPAFTIERDALASGIVEWVRSAPVVIRTYGIQEGEPLAQANNTGAAMTTAVQGRTGFSSGSPISALQSTASQQFSAVSVLTEVGQGLSAGRAVPFVATVADRSVMPVKIVFTPTAADIQTIRGLP